MDTKGKYSGECQVKVKAETRAGSLEIAINQPAEGQEEKQTDSSLWLSQGPDDTLVGYWVFLPWLDEKQAKHSSGWVCNGFPED